MQYGSTMVLHRGATAPGSSPCRGRLSPADNLYWPWRPGPPASPAGWPGSRHTAPFTPPGVFARPPSASPSSGAWPRRGWRSLRPAPLGGGKLRLMLGQILLGVPGGLVAVEHGPGPDMLHRGLFELRVAVELSLHSHHPVGQIVEAGGGLPGPLRQLVVVGDPAVLEECQGGGPLFERATTAASCMRRSDTRSHKFMLCSAPGKAPPPSRSRTAPA